MVPLIFKWVKSWKKAAIFWVFALCLSFIWKAFIYFCFGNIPGLDSLDILSGVSPLGTLYQFAVGILVYFLLKERKIYEANIVLALMAMIGLIFERDKLIWCVVCGSLIIPSKYLCKNTPIAEKNHKMDGEGKLSCLFVTSVVF